MHLFLSTRFSFIRRERTKTVEILFLPLSFRPIWLIAFDNFNGEKKWCDKHEHDFERFLYIYSIFLWIFTIRSFFFRPRMESFDSINLSLPVCKCVCSAKMNPIFIERINNNKNHCRMVKFNSIHFVRFTVRSWWLNVLAWTQNTCTTSTFYSTLPFESRIIKTALLMAAIHFVISFSLLRFFSLSF